ncbi:dihydrofolate reductase family protein [Streptomyces sp. IB2014 016-6]|uniref:dihydrofolate reductase family protein n=1 Tax=Streptomyces sp. IB2014 016-6 TaxID=2517818 RepID=UPI0011C9F2CB|nr:dihydrofolate reductase family protein [Streptomyces sp. IB2014 016-6]TXL91399.1 dihydrofolate reductase [Streptomyces sp. IB2014 016-6]
MTKLVLTTFLTLDGVMQGPGGTAEDTRDGFDLGGWTVPYGDEDFGRFMGGVMGRAGAFLLGRRTYDIFAAFWPRIENPDSMELNTLPKYVASHTLVDPEWADTTVISGDDLVKEVNAIKERTEGELQVHGSGRLAQSLLAHDLVDTLHLLTFPVVLGKGRRLFADGAVPTAFKHSAASVTGTGVVIHTYESAGRPAYGTYTLEDA